VGGPEPEVAGTSFRCTRSLLALVPLLAGSTAAAAEPAPPPFVWPNGARAALSLSFDDARPSQVETGLALLDRFGVEVTFFVLPSNVETHLAGWKRAVAAGHEIGNHTLDHPCSGNFAWSRGKALEDHSLAQMRREIDEANRRIHALLGVTPLSFAYPCGEKSVGRGVDTRSYVPLVAESFLVGRGWPDEVSNDPGFCDLAQVMGLPMDGKDFEQLLPILEKARESGRWTILVGHEIGESGDETTRVAMLEKLLSHVSDPANGWWVAPVGDVARYVREHRPWTE
jgi:peptidoglycan/xylan/chitin deacetylase (PgdA/CDA1 family)